MSDVTVLGLNSSSDTPVQRVTVFGNGSVTAGRDNLNGVTWTVVGAVVDYHRHLTINGFQGAFAGISNHGHNEIRVWNGQNDNILSSTLFTSDATSSSQMGFVAPRAAIGTAVGNELAIDTNATSPSGPLSTGRVLLEFSGTSTGITLNQRIVLTIATAMVAGIEAANYPGIVTAVTVAGGNTTIEIEIGGLDAQHWNPAQKGRVTTLNNLWSLQPIGAAIANTQSIAPVSGQSEVDITFSSVPSSIVVGRQVSLWITPSCATTVAQTNTLLPASILSITGTTVRVRVRNMRWRTPYTFGGTTDTNTANFSLHLGVGDPAHDPTMGGTSWVVWRNGTTGAVEGAAFGPCDVMNAATGAVAVGIGVVARTANAFRFGTSDTGNVAELVGNVLGVNGIRVGANGISASRIRHGRVTLVSGTATVNDANVTTNSRIFLSHAVISGSHGWLHVSARIAGTSFTISSSSGSDASQVDWMMLEP